MDMDDGDNIKHFLLPVSPSKRPAIKHNNENAQPKCPAENAPAGSPIAARNRLGDLLNDIRRNEQNQ